MPETIIRKFDGPYAFLEWATNAPCLWTGDLSSRKTDNADWSGTLNYEAAYDLAAHGWPEGLKLLKEKVETAEALMANRTAPRARQKRHDIAGYYPNPARAAAGEIFSMVVPLRPKPPTGPIINIRYDFGRLSHVSVDTIMTFGAAACSYINALEKKGYSVNLESFWENLPSSGSGSNTSFQFPLKKSGQHLSIGDIVFWIAHPSAIRRIGFSAMERMDIQKWYDSGYGRSHKVTSEPQGTLYLRIEDAAGDIDSCIKAIERKHQKIFPNLGKPIQPQAVSHLAS